MTPFFAPCHSPTFVTEDIRPIAAIIRSEENERVNDSISYQPDNQWREFVDSLHGQPTGLSKVHVEAVKAVWDGIKQSFSKPVPLPLTQPTAAGNVQLAWNRGPYYVELDIRSNGQLEWFFRNRETNDLDGTDDLPENQLNQSFLKRLALVVA